MTAMTLPVFDRSNQQARKWFDERHVELLSRAQATFRQLHADHREEAVAEVLATIFSWACRAAGRGRLDKLTAFWAVTFAARQYRQGRRLAGYTSSCVMSEAARAKRGLRVVSLDEPLGTSRDGREMSRLGSLADVGEEDPAEAARRRHDYPAMLREVSDKAAGTFKFLAESHGAGLQTELAAALMVSPGRITQLKAELADAFAHEGYRGPLGRRTSATAS